MIFKDITDEESGLLDDALIKCYEEKNITFDNESLYKVIDGRKTFKTSLDMPKLSDLYNVLCRSEKLVRLKSLLKSYVFGSMKFLDTYTNVDLNNKIVVSDLFEVEEQDLATIMYIVTEFYWDKIKENRFEKKILYLDEAWRLINQNRNTADFVFKVFKTIRKYGGAATCITQDIGDFFSLDDGKFGKGIINNSSVKCIFQLEENNLIALKDIINLSENEELKVMSLKRGNCLMIVGKEHVLLDVVSSKLEHKFISTDRKDLEKMEEE